MTRYDLASARRSLNLELISFSLRGVNLGKVVPFTIQIVANQATYTSGALVTNLPLYTISMLDVYYTTINGLGAGINSDRILLPISRTDYAQLSNKLLPGLPSVYWYEKLASPTFTLYQPPIQGYPTAQISGYVIEQFEDANIAGLETPDVVERALDALCAGLAKRLSVKFAPQRYELLKAEAKESWIEFSDDDREDADITILPAAQYWGGRGD